MRTSSFNHVRDQIVKTPDSSEMPKSFLEVNTTSLRTNIERGINAKMKVA
jgi:hypothetical protein